MTDIARDSLRPEPSPLWGRFGRLQDIVGLSHQPMGELSVHAKEFTLLAKTVVRVPIQKSVAKLLSESLKSVRLEKAQLTGRPKSRRESPKP